MSKKKVYSVYAGNSKERADEFLKEYREKRKANPTYVSPIGNDNYYRTQQAKAYADMSGRANLSTEGEEITLTGQTKKKSVAQTTTPKNSREAADAFLADYRKKNFKSTANRTVAPTVTAASYTPGKQTGTNNTKTVPQTVSPAIMEEYRNRNRAANDRKDGAVVSSTWYKEPKEQKTPERTAKTDPNKITYYERPNTINERKDGGLGYSKKENERTFDLEEAKKDPEFNVQKLKGGTTFGNLNSAADFERNFGPTPIDYMSEEEKDLYHYANGKFGSRAAQAYLETILPEANRRMTEDVVKKQYEEAKKNPAKGVLNDLNNAFWAGEGALYSAINILEGRPIDTNSAAYIGSNAQAAASRGVIEAANEKFGEGSALATVSQAGLSTLENAARLPFGEAGVAMMGMQVASSTIKDAKDRGASDAQAITLGIANGAIEYITELASLGNVRGLAALQENPTKTVRQLVMNIGSQIGVEASEEMFAEVLDNMADQMIMGENSENEIAFREYVAAGMTEEEAKRQVLFDLLHRTGEAGLIGGISGGLLGAPVATFNYGANRYIQNRANNLQNEAYLANGMAPIGDYEFRGEEDPGLQAVNEWAALRSGQIPGTTATFVTDGLTSQAAGQQAMQQETAEQAMEQQAAQNQEYEDQYAQDEYYPEYEGTESSAEAEEIARQMMTQDASEADQEKETENTPTENTTTENTTTENTTTKNNNTRTPENNLISDQTLTQTEERQETELQSFFRDLGENGSRAAEEYYDGENLDEYTKGFRAMYDAGRYGMGQNSAVSPYIAMLSKEQQEAAFKAGVADYDAEDAAIAQRLSNVTYGPERTGSFVNEANVTGAAATIYETLGRKTGMKMRVVNAASNIGGSYDRANGVFTFNVNAKNDLQTKGHELTHFIKDFAEKEYKTYRDLTVDALTHAGLNIDEEIERYRRAEQYKDLSRDEVIDEIVADSAGGFLNDQEFIDKVIRKDKTLAQKIIDFFDDMIDAMKEMMSDAGLKKVAKALKSQKEEYELCRNLWMDAFTEASENSRKGMQLDRVGQEMSFSIEQIGEGENAVKYVDLNVDQARFDGLDGDDLKKEAHKAIMERFAGKRIGMKNDVPIVATPTSARHFAYSWHNRKGFDEPSKAKFRTATELDNILEVSEFIDYVEYDKIKKEHPHAVMGLEHYKTYFKCGDNFYEGKITVLDQKRVRTIYDVTQIKNVPAYGIRPAKAGGRTPADVLNYYITRAWEKDKKVDTDKTKKFSVDDIDEKPRFGMDSQVEATKNLVAVHNITSDKLEKMFEYEGLPMPSIAITKADIGHENFGGISLVFRKETIDPKNKKNKVYSADAWTPTFPQIEYEVNDEAQNRLHSKFYELERQYGRQAADALYKYGVTLEDTLNRAGGVDNIIQEEQKNPRMAEAYLYDIGKGEEIPQVKTIETETGRKPIDKNTRALAEFIIDDIGRDRLKAGNVKSKDYMMSVAKRMVSEFGLDNDEALSMARKQGIGYYVNLSKTVRALLRGEDEIVTRETKTDASERSAYLAETLQSPEYREWLHNLFDGVEQSKGIYNGKDRYTRMGNRKSFKQTHYDVTAANIVRAMLNEGNGNAQNTAGFIAGIKSVRSSAAQRFASIEDIKAASNSLQTTDTNTYNQKLDELNTRLAKAIDQVRQDPNSFMESDSIGEILIEGIEKKMTSPAALKKLYEGYRYELSDEAAQEFSDIIKETRELPVNMFEAKPERVVAWDEIAMAILPTDVDQAIPEGLEQRGVEDIRYYVAGNEEDRLRVLNDNEDVRFSVDDVDEIVDVRSLKEENENLKKANDALFRELQLTGKTEIKEADVKKGAKFILDTYESQYDVEKLTRQMLQLYRYMHDTENPDGGEVASVAAGIARNVLNDSARADNSMVEQYRPLLHHIKNLKLKLADQDKASLDSEGGYEAFRRRNFGKLKLSKNGIGVDTAYEEMSGLWPEMFPADITNPADQLIRIADVVEQLKPQISNPYEANIDEMSIIAGHDIMSYFFSIKAKPATKMDQMQAKIDQARIEYKEAIKAYKRDIREKYDKAFREVKERNRQEIADIRAKWNESSVAQREEMKARMDALRNEKNQRIAAEQQRGRERLQEARDRSEATKTRTNIIREVQLLGKWLTEPTDKKHVPEGLRTVMAEFLGSIDFSSNQLNRDGEETQRTKAWNDLKDIYAAIVTKGGVYQDDKGNDMYMEIDPDLVQRMTELKDSVKDIDKVQNLNRVQLENLYNTILAMKKSIQEANKLHGNDRYEGVAQLAVAQHNELQQRKAKLERTGLLGSADFLLRSQMLDANTMFGRFGQAAHSVYREIRAGLDKKIRNTKIAQDYMAKLLEDNGVTQKDIKAWSSADAEKHAFDVSGGHIEMTTSEIMSLYLLSKRQQAYKHLYNPAGGIRLAPSARTQTKTILGREVKVGRVIDKSNTTTQITRGDVMKITGTLTDAQKAVADGISRFFTTTTSEWGNEVSMELYGYKKFMAPDYFPIVTDKNYIATTSAALEQGMQTLKNLGSTKSTVKNASNPIIIEDVFDVFARQADQMGSYNAFVVPLSDMQAWYNFNHADIGNMKQDLERVFGKQAHTYIEELMKDVNGSATKERDAISGLVHSMKSASVGWNIRTAIQQPTAYVRALAEMDAKYLIKGLEHIHVSDEEWERCKEYCPIAQWKDWGYFDVHTGRSMKSILTGPDTWKESLIESSMNLAGKGDEITWKRIWMACQAETEALHPELKKGTEEFYRQAGSRMSEIIDRTQVVDSVLHRSNLMKKGGMPTLYTAFMSEPTKSFNMLYRAYADLALDNTKENRRRASFITGVWLASGFATAIAAAVIDAVRDDDDKELWEKYLDGIAANLTDNWNPLNMIPLVKDIVSIFSGYSVNRIDMQGFQYLQYAMQELDKYKNGKSKLTPVGVMYKFAKPVSYFTGIPVYNLVRDTGAVIRTVFDAPTGGKVSEMQHDIMNASGTSDDISWKVNRAMKLYAEGKSDEAESILRNLKEDIGDEKKIDDKVKKKVKELPEVTEAQNARDAGDYETYLSIRADLAEVYGEDLADAAIGGFSTSNAVDSIGRYSNEEIQAAQRAIDMLDVKPSTLKSQITKAYKEEFINADATTRQKMMRQLEKLTYKGEKLYKDDDAFKSWKEK